MADNKVLDIDFSFKKNNVDELFFNLSENPDGCLLYTSPSPRDAQ